MEGTACLVAWRCVRDEVEAEWGYRVKSNDRFAPECFSGGMLRRVEEERGKGREG